jgi:hypothetical protein
MQSIKSLLILANLIIAHETLPPQIDYISPGQKQKVQKAYTTLTSLPQKKSKLWMNYIERKVIAYHTPIPSMGNYTPAELDAMF